MNSCLFYFLKAFHKTETFFFAVQPNATHTKPIFVSGIETNAQKEY
jgi:hypothetical protein